MAVSESITTADLFLRRSGATQTLPYIKPLPYTMYRAEVIARYKNDGSWAGNTRAANYSSPRNAQAYNSAYAKFESRIMSTANWAETLAQYKETFELASSLWNLTTKPMQTCAKALKRAGKGWKQPLKEANDAYLSYVYGIRPLLSDILNTFEIFDAELKPVTIRERGRYTSTYSWGSSEMDKGSEKCVYGAQIGATITVTNPNLARARALGLTNQVALAYDLIPFSFVFDYVYDVGSYLHSLDSMFGLSSSNSYVTYINHAHGTQWYYNQGVSWRETGMIREGMTPPKPVPYFNLNLGTWKLVHGLSLLAGLTVLR